MAGGSHDAGSLAIHDGGPNLLLKPAGLLITQSEVIRRKYFKLQRYSVFHIVSSEEYVPSLAANKASDKIVMRCCLLQRRCSTGLYAGGSLALIVLNTSSFVPTMAW